MLLVMLLIFIIESFKLIIGGFLVNEKYIIIDLEMCFI